jgi:biotin transport system substrate-specific component
VSTTALPHPRVLGDVVPGGLVRDIALVVGGAGLVGLAAQVSIQTPFSPVPFTGQTFAVVLAAGVLGSVRGVLSMLLYLAAGVLGLPWFAGGSSGAAAPSFGYIVGFVLAAAVIGQLAERGATRTPARTAAVMVLGNVAIYAVGVTWLKYAVPFGWGTAVSKGMVPFLVGDGLKIVLAAGLFPVTWRLVRRRS